MSKEIPAKGFKLSKDLNLESEFSPPTIDEWKAQVEKDLKGASYDKKLITKTYEGINLRPIYTRKDVEDFSFNHTFPGFDSYLRGNSSAGYHGQSWDVNQEIHSADVEEFNSSLQEALKNGQNCVNVLLDTATKIGQDADYAQTEHVGDIGLSISAINSMKRAFNNIDLTQYPLYLDSGYNSIQILSLISAHFKANNLDITKLNGSITADPISYLAVYGELPVNMNFVFDMMKNSLLWGNENSPNLKTIGINTLPFLGAGANAVQELAIALSNLVYYTNEMLDREVDPKIAVNKTQFTLGISNNYFLEIAKFRAARILISAIADEYGIESKELTIKIGAKSSSYEHTISDPYVNMLRSTTQSFSAILGGVNFITTNTFDELIRKPDSFSRRIARNTQTILREESHLDQVIDPAGGSYFIETLTKELADKALELFKEIESENGIFESLKRGLIQKWIKEVDKSRRKDINKRKKVIVGTNMFADVKEVKLQSPVFDQAAFKRKRAKYLERFRLNGTKEKHESVLTNLNNIASQNSAELVDLVTDAYLLGTTLGEISSALNSSHKETIEIEKLNNSRASEDFESLRDKSLGYKKLYGTPPKVYLANYGSINEFKARADFSKGFFESGGFEIIDTKGFSETESIVGDAIKSGAEVITICSTDENYKDMVAPIVEGLKSHNQNLKVILAGYPKDQVEAHKKSGIDDFIFMGADVMEKLTTLYSEIGGLKK